MKRIGIITYHAVCNFGAQLQAISTVGFLKRKGYEPVIIHWYPEDLDEIYQKRISSEQYQCHIDFAEQNMPLTKLCRTEGELVQVIDENNLDAIILGSDALFKYLPASKRKVFSKRKLKFVKATFASDQVWEGNPFWGSFITQLKKDIPVVVFSVSSQNAAYNKVNEQEYEELKKSLERFKYVTVRDEWTKQMVEYFLGNIDIPVTPDPVFSFNQNSYLPVPTKQDLLSKYNIPDKYVLLSFRHNYLNNDYIKEIETRLKSEGYTAVAFPTPEGLKDYRLTCRVSTPLSPLDWYYLIKYADGYIGELMHPIIVSLHNAVPFFCFDEYGLSKTIIPLVYNRYIRKSSKIYHILSKANLLDNMVSYHKDFRKITPQEVVNRLFTFDKQNTIQFLEFYQKQYEKSMNQLLEKINTLNNNQK